MTAFAQNQTTDLSSQTEPNDKTRQAMFNLQDPSAALTAGGAFYVSNPTFAYEIDPKKAYLNPTFQPLSIVLLNGQEYELPGRIRLIDQKVEVQMDDKVYDLDNQKVQAIIDAQGRVFVSGFDPTGRIKGTHLYEVAFAGADRRLLVNHSTVWEDPPQQNMFDTSEQRKTLKSVTRTYLVVGSNGLEINRLSDLADVLGLSKRSEGMQFAKRNRLRNETADYVDLLQFIEAR
ncbi:hypothetical protein LEM8419_02720 [Neolewinella maritima]|uniref:Uncharacterized protein n=2 Tax=Neolewinella maritima TaxID=1383882 RepID=A0ABN8FBE8_9BACT|nr:hypothetical protein LEM8419_02720 [Neolewinella maritima]